MLFCRNWVFSFFALTTFQELCPKPARRLWLYPAFGFRLLVSRKEFRMRTKIILACVDCKQRNYTSMKDKKLHAERLETKKHCRFCNKHTVHRETK
jgi:large subunit ribosomal protein L33